MRLLTGLQIDEWKLERRLGVGGEGQVWSAVRADGTCRALKFCAPSQSFYDEYEHLRSLNIPGIVRAYNYQESGEWLYYSMDYVEGQPFVSHLKNQPTNERYDECVHLLISITLILQQLHKRGLVHLDIKSENVVVSSDGSITLIDFGKAGIIGDHSYKSLGSHHSMSPEQRVGQYISQFSDVYSLAVMVFQALLDNAPPFSQIGRTWPSLLNCSSEIEQSFAGLIQQCLHLVPKMRPTMQALHTSLCEIQTNTHRTEYFPISQDYIGELPSLVGRSVIVVGPTGSGRRRIIRENIRLAYLEGTQITIANANPLNPFGLWKQILEDILLPLKLSDRTKRLLGVEQHLSVILPDVITNSRIDSTLINIDQLSKAIEVVLERSGDICIVLLHLEKADIGSIKLAQSIWKHIPKSISIWGVSTHFFEWAECISPPKWTNKSERILLEDLLPKYLTMPPSKSGRSPLQSSIKAWHSIANQRGEQSLQPVLSTKSIGILGLINEPCSPSVLKEIVPDLELLKRIGMLEQTNFSTDLQFSFLPQKWMLNEYLDFKDQRVHQHRILEKAFKSQQSHIRFKEQEILHSILGNHLVPKQIVDALWQSLLILNIDSVTKWWQLGLLHGVENTTTPMRIAELLINISNNHHVNHREFEQLMNRPIKPIESSMVQYLFLIQLSGEERFQDAIKVAKTLLANPTSKKPHLLLATHRELAWIYLKMEDVQTSQTICENALSMNLQDIFPEMVASLYIPLSSSIIHQMNFEKAVEVCSIGITLAIEYHLPTNYVAALEINAGLALFQRGDRSEACARWMNVRQHQAYKDNSNIRLQCMLAEIRESVERGQSQRQLDRLNECISLSQHLYLPEMLGEATAILLECATQRASKKLAKRAFQLYATAKPTDAFVVSHIRWLWLIGDISQAWSLIQRPTNSVQGYQLRVEGIRLAIILGEYESAERECSQLFSDKRFTQCKDLHLFATLCFECIQFKEPPAFLEARLDHPWTEINLGGLHLLALRKKLRGEDISTTLAELQLRAQSIQHRLYLALSEPELYTLG